MKYSQLLSALIVFAFATGCGSSSTEEQATTPAVITAPVQSSTTTSNTTVSNPPAPVSTVTTNTQVSPTPVQNDQKEKYLTLPANTNRNSAPVNAKTTTANGLNPAHGEPGHRCDISVGAPLNSKPTQPVVTNPQPQVVTPNQPVPVAAQPLVTAPGMNPQHGQPGHRCDIAVGAPLNSKPAQ